MSIEDRLNMWRLERDRLREQIARDPEDALKLNSVLADDLRQAELFIEYYEARLGKEDRTADATPSDSTAAR